MYEFQVTFSRIDLSVLYSKGKADLELHRKDSYIERFDSFFSFSLTPVHHHLFIHLSNCLLSLR